VIDTGASSMGPGLETVLAQTTGEALGLPPSSFEVRHPRGHRRGRERRRRVRLARSASYGITP
jgi:CO/xanthine dehydrogenase Mo-binding subunit